MFELIPKANKITGTEVKEGRCLVAVAAVVEVQAEENANRSQKGQENLRRWISEPTWSPAMHTPLQTNRLSAKEREQSPFGSRNQPSRNHISV
jgi:hypothetical protein